MQPLLRIDQELERAGISECSSDDEEEVEEEEEEEEDVQEEGSRPEVDIIINNVVCSFSVRRVLNLHQIALQASNVEYKKSNGMVNMRLRSPYITATIWKSGQITCTGAVSEDQALVAARRVARTLSKLDQSVQSSRPRREPRPITNIYNYRVVNVLGTCLMPFAIKIDGFASTNHAKDPGNPFETVSYEPELHPGVTVRFKKLKATLKVFSTGSMTVTAPRTDNIQSAVEKIYPFVELFRRERNEGDLNAMRTTQRIRNIVKFNAGDFCLDGLDVAYLKSECADLFAEDISS